MPGTLCSASLVTLATIAVAGLASAAPPDDACAFLTKQDAVTALGEEVSAPKALSGLPMGPGMTASSCEYVGSGYRRIQLTVRRMTPEAAAMSRAMCAQKASEGLAGLGDVACWYDEKHEELQVMSGTTLLTIELGGLKSPTEPIKAAAKSVYSRVK